MSFPVDFLQANFSCSLAITSFPLSRYIVSEYVVVVDSYKYSSKRAVVVLQIEFIVYTMSSNDSHPLLGATSCSSLYDVSTRI